MRVNPLIYSSFLLGVSMLANTGAAASTMPPLAQVGVEIVADDGSVFARYDLSDRSQQGKLRAYLEAQQERNYAIRVHNRSGGRVGLVIAVDGRNILSGEKSYLHANEPMYVLGAGEHATYCGWRTSDTRVHRFFFTDVDNSYADAWGDRSAMGVIAVAAFREVPPVRPRRQSKRRSGLEREMPRPSAPSDIEAARTSESSDRASAAGTGFGDGDYSRSVRVHFKPQHQAFVQHFIKYEWRDTLVRLGVIHDSPPLNRFWPEQLGQAQDFAPFPPGYWSRRH